MNWLKYHLAGVLVSLFCVFLFTFPAVFHLHDSFIGDGWDSYQQAGYQTLFIQNIKDGILPFSYTQFWRYPVGFDFSRGFDSYLSVTLGALLVPFLSMPLSYNLSLFILLFLNGFFSYLFVTRLTQSRLLGIVGLLMFGFSFPALARAGSHLNLVFIGALPLLGMSVLQLLEDKAIKRQHLFLYLFTLFAILTGSLQYTLIFAICLLFTLVWVGYVYKDTLQEVKTLLLTHKTHLFWSGLISLSLFVTLYHAHIQAIINGSFSFFARDAILQQSTPALRDFFLPNSYFPFWYTPFVSGQTVASIEKTVFIGFLELVLFLGFFLTPRISKKIKVTLLGLALFSFVLALGYGTANSFPLLPYRFLHAIFPFHGISEPGRFIIVTLFIMMIAAVLLLKSIVSFRLRHIIIGIVIAVLLLERITTGFYLTPSLKNDTYISFVKERPRGAVLDLPINPYYAPYNILSYYYQKPIVNGYFHWSADTDTEKAFLQNGSLNRYNCSESDPIIKDGMNLAYEEAMDYEMLQTLADNNVPTIVIHKTDKYYHPVCTNVRMRIGRLFPWIRTLSPHDTQQQLAGSMSEGIPQFSVYLPYKGTLALDGAYLAPSAPTTVTILVNNQPITETYGWKPSQQQYSLELTPSQTLTLPVEAGSTLTFKANTFSSYTAFSLWYRYAIDTSVPAHPYQSPLELLYEDGTAAVYTLR